MTAALYTRLAATAVRLLAKYGAPLLLTRTTEGEYDPETGTSTGGTATYNVTGAAFDYAQDDIDGTLIRRGDMRVYIAPDAAVTPQTGDTLPVQGFVWNVVESRPLQPADKIVLHDVQIRR